MPRIGARVGVSHVGVEKIGNLGRGGEEGGDPHTLDESGKSIIERIATFLGILFGISILSNNFPPPYLKGNSFAKVMIIISLVCFLLSIGAGILATQVRFYRRYTYNVTMMGEELKRIIRYKMLWLRVANLLFALGTLALAVLLIIVVWSL